MGGARLRACWRRCRRGGRSASRLSPNSTNCRSPISPSRCRRWRGPGWCARIRGPNGGYTLMRRRSEISLWDVRAALEGVGPISAARRSASEGPAPRASREARRARIAAAFWDAEQALPPAVQAQTAATSSAEIDAERASPERDVAQLRAWLATACSARELSGISSPPSRPARPGASCPRRGSRRRRAGFRPSRRATSATADRRRTGRPPRW